MTSETLSDLGEAPKKAAAKNVPVTIRQLLEAGAHFGHQTRRWNPKMRKFIFEIRNGLHIIDLPKTLQQIREGAEIVRTTIQNKKSILFVGTKKQAKAVIRDVAEQSDEFYICERWLGGQLTNMPTIRKSIRKLETIEKRIASGGEGLKKKELALMARQQEKLDRNLSGVRAMKQLPGLIIVVDPNKEHIAVAEANTLGIPVMALVDTNCDPDPISHVIACNDDALKSIKLILDCLGQAIIQEKNSMIASGDLDSKPAQGIASASEAQKDDTIEEEKEATPTVAQTAKEN